MAEAGPPGDVLSAHTRTMPACRLALRLTAEMSQVSNAYLGPAYLSQVEHGLPRPSLRALRAITDALELLGERRLVQAGRTEPAAALAGSRADTEAAIPSPARSD
jgi:hypothetical protein